VSNFSAILDGYLARKAEVGRPAVARWRGSLLGACIRQQWYATEKQGRVVVPPLFWWLSLAGALLLLSYAALYQRDSVFVAAYAFSWLPYLRNLLIHHRTEKARPTCPSCTHLGNTGDRFCCRCGQSHS
jgi:hypothetical protein